MRPSFRFQRMIASLGMRIRYALVAAPLLLLSLVALAQPKRAAKAPEDHFPAAKADKGDKPEAKSEVAPSVGSSTAEDLGEPPPRPTAGFSRLRSSTTACSATSPRCAVVSPR